MSWNLNVSGTKSQSAVDAKRMAVGSGAPKSVVDYVSAAIDGLVKKEGKDVRVNISGHGHLCNGSDYENSDATIMVQKAV